MTSFSDFIPSFPGFKLEGSSTSRESIPAAMQYMQIVDRAAENLGKGVVAQFGSEQFAPEVNAVSTVPDAKVNYVRQHVANGALAASAQSIAETDLTVATLTSNVHRIHDEAIRPDPEFEEFQEQRRAA